ncbi:hypothetical protein Ancab_039270 [Ancistrocladus abbreviatus]
MLISTSLSDPISNSVPVQINGCVFPVIVQEQFEGDSLFKHMVFYTKLAVGGTPEPRGGIVETTPYPYQPTANEEWGSEEAAVGSMINPRCINYAHDNASHIKYAHDKASPLSSLSQKERGTLAPSPSSPVATLKRQGDHHTSAEFVLESPSPVHDNTPTRLVLGSILGAQL